MKRRTKHRSRFGVPTLGGALALCACLAASPGHTQVLEIDAAGQVTVHDRPEVTSADGATAIARPAVKLRSASPATSPPRAAISRAAALSELSPDLVDAVAWRESGYRAGVVSRAGAVGEMQLMPGTAASLGVDPHDSQQNFSGGAAYLSRLLKRYDGDMVRALAAYNAGPRAVDRYGGVPPYKETQDYVAAILDRLSQQAVAAPER
jgi:soluble lytic murein transglycosylase-like protein